MAAYIDLHTHTTASDGSLTPAQLVRAAKDAGLSAVAVTDHDTTAGLTVALVAGEEAGIEVVPGVEVSAEHSPGQMHIVGLFIDHTAGELSDWLARIVEGRDQRNPKIIAKLRDLGVDITMEEVEAVAGEGTMGRPHIARVLVEKGIMATTQEAFDRYLAKGGPAYFDRVRATSEESIKRIHAAGGLAVLAHPHLCGATDADELKELVSSLKEMGLDGIEVFYSNMTPQDEALAVNIAEELGLLKSGGTDFHGASKPEIQLGVGGGNLAVPYDFLRTLKEAKSKKVE